MSGEYTPGDYCKSAGCEYYPLWKTGDESGCDGCEAKGFHDWLDREGYKIIKEIETND